MANIRSDSFIGFFILSCKVIGVSREEVIISVLVEEFCVVFKNVVIRKVIISIFVLV